MTYSKIIEECPQCATLCDVRRNPAIELLFHYRNFNALLYCKDCFSSITGYNLHINNDFMCVNCKKTEEPADTHIYVCIHNNFDDKAMPTTAILCRACIKSNKFYGENILTTGGEKS